MGIVRVWGVPNRTNLPVETEKTAGKTGRRSRFGTNWADVRFGTAVLVRYLAVTYPAPELLRFCLFFRSDIDTRIGNCYITDIAIAL